MNLKPELVTFDCAHTLLDVKWQPGRFAVTCAERVGLDLDAEAGNRYDSILGQRNARYLQLNLERDHKACDAFWVDVTRDWLIESGHDADIWHPKIDAVSKEIGFSARTEIFRVFDDVLPCLDNLSSQGIKTAIISNWDYSLHRILDFMGLGNRFSAVIASLEEGYEKPDPRIFLDTLEKLDVKPENALHVGDDPIDDLQGARNVGMRALLLDRSLTPPTSAPYISSLNDMFGANAWNG